MATAGLNDTYLYFETNRLKYNRDLKCILTILFRISVWVVCDLLGIFWAVETLGALWWLRVTECSSNIILFSSIFYIVQKSQGESAGNACTFHSGILNSKTNHRRNFFFSGKNTDTFISKPRAFPFISIQGSPQDRIYVAFHSKELPDVLNSLWTSLVYHRPYSFSNKVQNCYELSSERSIVSGPDRRSNVRRFWSVFVVRRIFSS